MHHVKVWKQFINEAGKASMRSQDFGEEPMPGETGIAPEDIYPELLRQFNYTADEYNDFEHQLAALNHIAFDAGEYEDNLGHEDGPGEEMAHSSAELYHMLDPNDPELSDMDVQDTGRSGVDIMNSMGDSAGHIRSKFGRKDMSGRNI